MLSLSTSCVPLTLRAEVPSIFLEKSGRGRDRSLPLPDFSRKIEETSASGVFSSKSQSYRNKISLFVLPSHYRVSRVSLDFLSRRSPGHSTFNLFKWIPRGKATIA